MKKITTLLIICALSLSSIGQVQLYSLDNLNLPEKGLKYTGYITYALPTTTLKVTVSVSKVQDVRGYYADYAESLLGLTNIIQQNRTYYTLNSVVVEPLTTADMSKCYRAYTSNAAIAEAMNDATYSPKTTYPDESLTTYQTHSASLPDFFKNYADISYTQQSEAFVETKIIDGVVTQVPASHTKTVSKSFESKAREAADAIAKSRKDQYNLVAGEQETAYTGEALAIMLSELKKWENNYISLFAGVSIADTFEYVFYLTPKENLEQMTAFYFDANRGFSQTKGVTSDAYMLNMRRMYDQKIIVGDWNFPLTHFITRNPQPVRVSMSHDKTVHDFGIVNMYQAGSLFLVHPSTNNPLDINSIGIVF